MISFWMPQQQLRVGRGPVDKKVSFFLPTNFFLDVWMLIKIVFFRLLVHIFYEPVRACFDQDG